ncbi:MAG: T9SS type A sorting domain-containing protein [Saprospiraceae bacterium]|nr:T9SS type A sorting domain-containing protein [Saprospiraceae bacterium]
MIDVSTRLYDAIVRYQTTPGQSTPFSQYLSSRTDIPFYERLEFFQQYYLDGAPLPTDSETELPLSLRPPLPIDECKCKMIFNTVQAASPGTLNADGTISPRIENSGGKVKVGNKAYYWWVRQSKGAAKWHCVWMEATKAGPTDRSWRMTMPDSLHISPMRGQLRYNLLCNDYAELPADCGCRKPVTLYYEYDTELEVHAERHTEGWFQKNAVAAGEDIAVVMLHYEGSNNTKVLRANRLAVSAECNLTMNTDFWVNAVDVARDIAFFFVPDTTGLQYTNLLNNLANSIQTLIQTPFYSDQACPAGELRQATLAKGDTLIYIEPNKPVNLYAFSFTNLMAGGKRSFFSWSRVNSDFHLTGYVPGGLLGGQQDHCCTRKIANWVLASDTAPLSTDDLKKEVGIILGAFSPWPVPPDPLSGIVPITKEYGWMAVSVNPLCDSHGLTEPSDDRNVIAIGEKVQISLFDLSGRLLRQWKDVQKPGDVRQFIMEQGGISPATGIYILQMSGECGNAVHKVILK